MGASAAFELFADAPGLARHILDARRAPVDEPIRSEIFGPERFEQHARSLAAAQRVGSDALADASFFPRIFDNARVLRQSHALIGNYARAGLSVSPAAEWLLDNFHVVESQLVEIRDGLPRHYFRRLPKLADAPLTGMPRVYGIAWAYVAHTGSDFDLALLKRFVAAYQEVDELDIGELWALPTTLRVVLIENLRRMAERIVANTGARDLADACCDREGAMSADGVRAAALRAEACGVGHAFLAQVHQRLQNADARRYAVIRQWMAESGANATQAVAEWHARQSIANVTVRNIMTSLRRIGGADWKDVVESLCAVDRAFAPVPAFRHDDFETRDACRHAVELLARRSHLRERAVAESVLAKLDANERARAHPAYFLIGPGRRELARGLAERTRLWSLDGVASAHRLAIYLVVVGALTSLVVFAALREATVEPLTLALAALLLAFPASEIVVSLVNRIVSELAPPVRIPRRDFSGGIPPEHRVLVAIPALIGSIGEVEHLGRQLLNHYLANPERHAQFALLTDFTDAATETCDGDDTLIAAATAAVQGLNTAYPSTGAPPRFLLLHRGRSFNAGERMWIGWERKRGKLEQLVRVLTGEGTPFVDLGALSVPAPGTRYVVALDSDTQTTPGAVRSLVAIAAHPLNAARPAPAGRRRVVAGYGILQPRVVPPLPRSTDRTWFHWLFAGQCGIDPYSAATSEVYQDVFGTGTFTGKGLLDVAVMRAMLDRRVPENTMLSHDLFEGSVARCGYVSDVVIVEDAPAHAEVAAARTHRWTRGDWQLLPFLLRARRYGLDGVARWKIVDNLRRSLIAPCSLVALALAWATGAPSPGVAMSVVLAAFGTGPLLGALAGLSPSRDGIALAHFVRLAAADFTRAIAGALWQFAMLLRNAWLMHDAILRTLLRLVRRRRLLQWVTAAQVQAAVTSDLGAFARRHAPSMLAGVALFGAIALWRGPPAAGAWGMLALLA
ncbi:MAG: carbohydrate-binding protein, partial [Betaproteobacteria bacterium]